MKFVPLNGRLCSLCGRQPRFFHEYDDDTVVCCRCTQTEGEPMSTPECTCHEECRCVEPRP